MTTHELVVLVNEDGAPIGAAPKATIHTSSTPLHRAFSCYIFNKKGDFLLTRRAFSKKTFPGIWTNSLCGHPAPEELDESAIIRRAEFELGMSLGQIKPLLPKFRYRAEMNGIVENEICPVYRAVSWGQPTPNPAEVAEYRWVKWKEFLNQVDEQPEHYSPWCRMQVAKLIEDNLGE